MYLFLQKASPFTPHLTSSPTKCDFLLLISKTVNLNLNTGQEKISDHFENPMEAMDVLSPHHRHMCVHTCHSQFCGSGAWTQDTFLLRSLPYNTDHNLSGAQLIYK